MKRNLWMALFLCTSLACAAQNEIAALYYSLTHYDIPAYRLYSAHSELSTCIKNDFFAKELMRKSLCLAFYKDKNLFSIDIEHYGHTSYGKLSIDLGYGRMFGYKLSVILQTIYIMQHAEHYTCRHSFTIDLSCSYQITSKVGIAVNIFNPIKMRYGVTGKDVIPLCFSLQAHFHNNEKILFYAIISQYLPGELDIGVGLCYHPISQIIFEGGCGLRQCGIGIHIPYRTFRFGIQSEWYYQNSLSLAASFLYQFDLKQTNHEHPLHKHTSILDRNIIPSTTSHRSVR